MTSNVRPCLILLFGLVLAPCAAAQEAALVQGLTDYNRLEIENWFRGLLVAFVIFTAWASLCVCALIVWRVARQRVDAFINDAVAKLGELGMARPAKPAEPDLASYSLQEYDEAHEDYGRYMECIDIQLAIEGGALADLDAVLRYVKDRGAACLADADKVLGSRA